MHIIILYFYVLQYFFVFLFADNCQKHTKICKACNSCVQNANDMTLLHLNKCFNGKFNDDVKCCSIENYLYCFSCKTKTPVHNDKKCKFDDV